MQPLLEPQLDEVRVIEADGAENVQSDFSYRVQNHRPCRIPWVQSLRGKSVSVY